MSFGSRLRDKRKALGITQPQLAKMLNVSQSAIGSWETDINSPRATLLYDLFDILHCDANFLFQDETRKLYEDSASPEEFENIIKKYRELDDHGQAIVNMVLKEEYSRCKKENTPTDDTSKKMAEFPQQITKAAHARTDIGHTPEGRANDDALMENDEYWK